MTAERKLRVLNRGREDFDTRIDVAVVGAGAAGLVTALAACEAGASTLVFERDSTPSGSTSLSAGLIPAAGSRWQRKAGIDDSAERLTDDIIRKSKCESDHHLAARLSSQSADTLHWLADRWNVPLSLIQGFRYPGHTVERMHGTPSRTGSELMGALLTATACEGNVTIVTEARVDTLFRDEKSITGIGLTRSDGNTENVGASSVVLACNGFGGNKELIARYIPSMDQALYFGHPGNTGDAIVWGEQLGAATRHLSAYQGHASVARPHAILISWAVMMEGGIQTNVDGKRFSNEHEGYSEQAERVLQQPRAIAWNIFDQRIFDIAHQFEDFREAARAGAFVRADDVSTLAEKTGLPAADFAATMGEVNALSDANGTDAFSRRFTKNQKLTAPYFAVRVEAALFHTQGGLEIDECARVLREDGDIIDNLFATGDAARGVSGPGVAGYLSGNGLLAAVTLGHIAGREAALTTERR